VTSVGGTIFVVGMFFVACSCCRTSETRRKGEQASIHTIVTVWLAGLKPSLSRLVDGARPCLVPWNNGEEGREG